jgi:hypothetical protein
MLGRTRAVAVIGSVAVAGLFWSPAQVGAHAPSGAIFTTVADGSEVNLNIYPSKEAVYLDGGPGVNAPQTAAGLDDGDYYFQVTDPSGKVLLSTDAIECRRFTVADGVITSVAPSGACAHVTGVDVDHNAVTVQLMPYDDTPNPGGVYKAWVTFVEDYAPGSGKHGFVPSHSKTDNFKVRQATYQEIDTRFFDDGNASGIDEGTHEPEITGISVTWVDTHGASNKKWVNPKNHFFAHVEAVESGRHTIHVTGQPGCDEIGAIRIDGRLVGHGPQAVSVDMRVNYRKNLSKVIEVACLNVS